MAYLLARALGVSIEDIFIRVYRHVAYIRRAWAAGRPVMASLRRPGSFTLVETSNPDRDRAEEGLRLLGRMIAHAYARDRAMMSANGHKDPALIPQEEERSEEPEN